MPTSYAHFVDDVEVILDHNTRLTWVVLILHSKITEIFAYLMRIGKDSRGIVHNDDMNIK